MVHLLTCVGIVVLGYYFVRGFAHAMRPTPKPGRDFDERGPY
jgi:hypothetical protein